MEIRPRHIESQGICSTQNRHRLRLCLSTNCNQPHGPKHQMDLLHVPQHIFLGIPCPDIRTYLLGFPELPLPKLPMRPGNIKMDLCGLNILTLGLPAPAFATSLPTRPGRMMTNLLGLDSTSSFAAPPPKYIELQHRPDPANFDSQVRSLNPVLQCHCNYTATK